MAVGDIIKQIRIRRRLTQKQLGEMCGLSEPAIRNYELGNRKPSLETLERIAAALNVTTFEIVLPELLFRLEEYGFVLDVINGEPIFRINQKNLLLRELLLETWENR